ncbi:hypothetical protein L6452_25929 [Arctium lappa]|uniref:Uncharacterized protein n=1 Tax=Arctium lappa TaxID=4217 RepID=A0ACB9ACS2_ARCLA|nr:hypothetical protein L6452_25929 [Arctium lappa]
MDNKSSICLENFRFKCLVEKEMSLNSLRLTPAASLKKLSSNVGLLFSSSHTAEWEKTCKPISSNMERYRSEGEQVEGEQRKGKRKLIPSEDGIKIRKHTR